MSQMQVYAEEISFNHATQNLFILSKKENTVKTVNFLMLIVFTLVACDKPIESNIGFTELNIIQTNTPATGTINQNIVSTIRVSGPDLCYRFAYFTVNQQQLLVDIHAIGTHPTEPMGCAQAIYNKDTTLSIPATTAGKYVLRFYNGSQLFKSDTLQVN